MSGKEGESGPECWRATQQDRITGSFRAEKVIELSNPGTIYEFHSQFYIILENGQLRHCSVEETRKAVIEKVAQSVKQEEAERVEKKFIEDRARALGWKI